MSNNYVIGSEAVSTFGNGTAPTRSCVIMNSALHCVDIADQSVDSMDLGVVCKTYQDVIGSVINRTIDQTLQTCPEQTTTCVTNQPAPTTSQSTTTSGPNQPTTNSQPTNSQPATTSGPNQPTNSQPITTGGPNQPTTNSKLTMTSETNQPATTSEVDQSTLAKEMIGSCPVAALGGLIGLLVVVLLGLVIGLTVTCCVLGKRRSQKQQAE